MKKLGKDWLICLTREKNLLETYSVTNIIIFSDVDPKTLNLEPDPGFWPNLYQDPALYRYYQFWKTKLKIILEKKISFKKSIRYFLTITYKKKIIFLLKSCLLTSFYLHFIQYLHVWIRIRNTDPDPESSWIRIRIHNTALNL